MTLLVYKIDSKPKQIIIKQATKISQKAKDKFGKRHFLETIPI